MAPKSWLEAAAEEEGVPPPKLPDQPTLFSWLTETYQAFWRLSRQRPSGFGGPEKIPASDILNFYAMFEPFSDGLEFYDMITAMDALFIEKARAVTEKKRKAGEGGSG